MAMHARPPKGATTDDWFSYWLESFIGAQRRWRTYHAYELAYRLQIGAIIGSIAVENLTPDRLQSAVNVLALKYAPRTVALSVTALRGSLDAAVADGRLTVNPASALKLPSGSTPHEHLEPDEVPAFIAACQDRAEYWGPLFITAVTTGLRQGEIFGLRWPRVGPGGTWVAVTEQWIIKQRTWDEVKTSAGRRVIHTPQLTAALLVEQQDRNARQALRVGPRRWTENQLVFPNTVGRIAPSKNVSVHLRRVCAAAGVRPVSMHGLRHTYVTALIDRGLDLTAIAKLAGHARITTTFDLYGHLTDGMRKRSADAWDEMLGGQVGPRGP